ncbi:MAG: hypothetical protein MO847_12275 [Candidatus Protistobacter heckmanni]|nr:hypothetical protein [Candidatus Protistobacter heckmanni]
MEINAIIASIGGYAGVQGRTSSPSRRVGRTERVGKSDALSLSADGGGAEETLATSAGAASSAGPAVVIAQSLLDLIDEWRLTGY